MHTSFKIALQATSLLWLQASSLQCDIIAPTANELVSWKVAFDSGGGTTVTDWTHTFDITGGASSCNAQFFLQDITGAYQPLTTGAEFTVDLSSGTITHHANSWTAAEGGSYNLMVETNTDSLPFTLSLCGLAARNRCLTNTGHCIIQSSNQLSLSLVKDVLMTNSPAAACDIETSYGGNIIDTLSEGSDYTITAASADDFRGPGSEVKTLPGSAITEGQWTIVRSVTRVDNGQELVTKTLTATIYDCTLYPIDTKEAEQPTSVTIDVWLGKTDEEVQWVDFQTVLSATLCNIDTYELVSCVAASGVDICQDQSKLTIELGPTGRKLIFKSDAIAQAGISGVYSITIKGYKLGFQDQMTVPTLTITATVRNPCQNPSLDSAPSLSFTNYDLHGAASSGDSFIKYFMKAARTYSLDAPRISVADGYCDLAAKLVDSTGADYTYDYISLALNGSQIEISIDYVTNVWTSVEKHLTSLYVKAYVMQDPTEFLDIPVPTTLHRDCSQVTVSNLQSLSDVVTIAKNPMSSQLSYSKVTLADAADEAACLEDVSDLVYELALPSAVDAGVDGLFHSLPQHTLTKDSSTGDFTLQIVEVPSSDNDLVLLNPESPATCKLKPLTDQESCTSKFLVQAYLLPLAGDQSDKQLLGTAGELTVEYNSQCDYNDPSSAQGWVDADSVAVNLLSQGYQIASGTLEVELPRIMPTMYPDTAVEDNFFTHCKAIQYKIAPDDSSHAVALSLQQPANFIFDRPKLIITTSARDLVNAVSNYKVTVRLTLTVVKSEDSSLLSTYATTPGPSSVTKISFDVYDFCQSITFLDISASFPQDESYLADFSIEPQKISLFKPALSPETRFDLGNLAYIPFESSGPSDVCGSLEVQSSSTQGSLLMGVPADNEVVDSSGFSFTIGTPEAEELGQIYETTIKLKPDLGASMASQAITVRIEVSKCRVYAVNRVAAAQFTEDITMNVFQIRRIPFSSFQQEPDCEYSQSYFVTLVPLGSSTSSLPSVAEALLTKKWQPIEGLVSIEEATRELIIDPQGYESVIDKTFAVYIGTQVEDGDYKWATLAAPFRLTCLADYYGVPNNPPGILSLVEQVSVEPDSPTTVHLGQLFDIEEDPFRVSAITAKRANSEEPFRKLDWVFLRMDASADDLTLFVQAPPEEAGQTFSLQVTLTDENETSPASASFYVSLSVLAPDGQEEEEVQDEDEGKQEESPLEGDEPEPGAVGWTPNSPQTESEEADKSFSVSPGEVLLDGSLLVSFSRPIRILAAIASWTSENGGSQMLEVDFRPSEATRETLEVLGKTQAFSWRVSEVTVEEEDAPGNRRLQAQAASETSGEVLSVKAFAVQLHFSEPLYVSQEAEPDRVTIQLQPEVFSVELSPGELARLNLAEVSREREIKLKPLLAPETAKVVEGTATALAATIGSVLALGLAMQILLSHVLQYLWGFLNTLQIVVLTVLFTVSQPANSFHVLTQVMKLINFDIKHRDVIFAYLVRFEARVNAFNQKFEEAGFDSQSFLVETSDLVFEFSIFAGYLIIRAIVLCAAAHCLKKQNCLTRHFKGKLNFKMIGLRFLLEGCLELGIATLLALHGLNKGDFVTVQDSVSTCLALVALLGLCLAPVYLVVISYRLRKKAKELKPELLEEYQGLFSAYREDPFSMAYGVMFFLRRYLIVALLVLFPKKQYTQVCCHLASTLVMMMYLGQFLPYRSKAINCQELVNEALTIVASYHLYVFTDWVSEKERQFEAGWSMVAILAACAIFNISILVGIGMRGARRKAKLAKAKLRRMRQAEQQKQHYKLGVRDPVKDSLQKSRQSEPDGSFGHNRPIKMLLQAQSDQNELSGLRNLTQSKLLKPQDQHRLGKPATPNYLVEAKLRVGQQVRSDNLAKFKYDRSAVLASQSLRKEQALREHKQRKDRVAQEGSSVFVTSSDEEDEEKSHHLERSPQNEKVLRELNTPVREKRSSCLMDPQFQSYDQQQDSCISDKEFVAPRNKKNALEDRKPSLPSGNSLLGQSRNASGNSKEEGIPMSAHQFERLISDALRITSDQKQ